MSIGSSLTVDRPLKIKHGHQPLGPQVKMACNQVGQLFVHHPAKARDMRFFAFGAGDGIAAPTDPERDVAQPSSPSISRSSSAKDVLTEFFKAFSFPCVNEYIHIVFV